MSKNINLDITLKAWADIVLKQWRDKMMHLNIGVSGALFDSLKFEIIKNASGGSQKIDFLFKLYGRYVDMGVGKEFYIGNPGDIGGTPQRKPKRWYSPVLMGEAAALRDILSKKYGMIGAGLISEKINSSEKKRNNNKTTIANRPLTNLDKVWMKRNGLL